MERRRQPNFARNHGSTLIEVLVAIVVLSIGLLGMIGLHAASLQNNRDARLQSTAVRLGAELAKRMRGNRTVAADPDAGVNPYLQSNLTALPSATGADCFAATCATPLDVARWDMQEWLRRVFAVDAGLPGARVVVCFDRAPYDGDGLPRWSCTGSGDVAYVKLGWTRASPGRSAAGTMALEHATDADSRPGVVLPVASGVPS